MAGNPRYLRTTNLDPFMRINDDVKRCVVFIACKLGGGKIQYVGSGFIVVIPSQVEDEMGFHYMVTAKHVALVLDGLDVFVQALQKDGSVIKFDAPDMKWVFHLEDDVDVAVIPITPLGSNVDYCALSTMMFLGASDMQKLGIGIGDEVIVSGLFTRLRQTIDSIVRIGNIAMLPRGKVITGEITPGKYVPMEGYLIDQRSLGGMSGCPVFVRETVNYRDLVKVEDGNSTPFHGMGRMHFFRHDTGALGS